MGRMHANDGRRLFFCRLMVGIRYSNYVLQEPAADGRGIGSEEAHISGSEGDEAVSWPSCVMMEVSTRLLLRLVTSRVEHLSGISQRGRSR